MMSDLKIQRTPFTNMHESNTSYVWIENKYYKSSDIGFPNGKPKREDLMLEIYKKFEISQPPRDSSGHLEDFVELFENLTKGLDLREVCKNDRYEQKRK